MPPSTRPATPGPSSQLQVHKRYAADADLLTRETKRPKIDPKSPETRAHRDSNRDNNKRRRRKKKKVPVVIMGGSVKNVAAEGSGGPASTTFKPNEIARHSSMSSETEVSSATCTSKSATPAPCTVTGPGANAHMAAKAAGTAKPNGNSEIKGSSIATSLDDKVAQLTRELAAKNELLKSHQALFTQVQQTITCQICLELMHKPFALSPCGHLACYDCLVQWFKAPPPDSRPLGPVILRQKTCPHCRGIVRERPIEVWGVKSIVQSVAKSNLVANHPAPTDPPTNQNSTDPWGGIFPKVHQHARRPYPWFASIEDRGGPHGARAPRGEHLGMLDMEDGGIYRCFDCMHEIWDGVCTSCGRLYPGHQPNPDDDDTNHDWVDDEPIAEEVDIGDDPGWMGLEGGDGDDVGDEDDHDPIPMHQLWIDGEMAMMVGPARFYHDDLSDDYYDEDDIGDSDYGLDDRGGGDEDEDRYESDFIDDDVEISVAPYVPTVYEISDSGGEDGFDHEASVEGDGTPRRSYGENSWSFRHAMRRIIDSEGSEEEDSEY